MLGCVAGTEKQGAFNAPALLSHILPLPPGEGQGEGV